MKSLVVLPMAAAWSQAIRGVAYDEDPDDPVAHVIGTFMATHGTYL